MNEQTIFTAALARKNPDERQAYLNDACGENAALRSQVEELLAAGEGAESFLEHPPVGLDATVDASLCGKDTVDNELGGVLPPLEPCDKPDRIGKLGDYEIIEVVGQGGMGTVLRAFDTKLSRIVALKVMASELAANPTAVKRFLREAQSAAAVVHDHVVTIHAIHDQSRPPYLVMEFVEGQTLQQKIDREGALPLKQILRIGSQMAAGLAAAHKTGLIHRDVKPANILLENGVQRVKITDFGLARAADDVEMTKTGLIAGTPQYMSPEQAHGQSVDSRSDLFSLGSVLYTMCTGRAPFRAESTMGTLRRVCDDTPRPIQEVNAEIPGWLSATIDKLLAKRPEDRFQSAVEVGDLLSQFLAYVQQPATMPLPVAPGLAMTDAPAVDAPRKNDPGNPRRTSSGVGVILAVCAAVLALPILAFVLLLVGAWFLFSKSSLQAQKKPYATHSAAAATETIPARLSEEGSPAKGNLPPLAFAPFDAKQAKIHQEDCAKRLGVEVEVTNSLGMKLRLIPPGEFMMGQTQEETDRLVESLEQGGAGEYDKFVARMSSPQHKVRLTQPFYFGAHEVTVGQYRKFIDATKYVGTIEQLGVKDRFKWTASAAEPTPEERAVIGVSWDDAKAFCKWLSKQDGVTYDLPSEAQWEYACRAGTTTAWSFGDEAAGLAEHAIHGRESFWPAEVVGSKAANPFGLYDMHGNADEWCLDWHHRDFYAQSPSDDPVNLIDPKDKTAGRVARGGAALSAPWWTRSTTRAYEFQATPNTPKGFRVAVVGNADLAKVQARSIEATNHADEAASWKPLFNGQDLTGWDALPADTRDWKVENGVLVGNAARSLLVSKRDDYQDFHLRAEVKINPGGDSGLYFRCHPDEKLPRLMRAGYEAQIIAPEPKASRTGSLFKFAAGETLDLKLIDANLVQADTWFRLEVIASGNHITVKVDDQTTADYVDERPSEVLGHIALDTYKEGTRVQFRNLEIRELPPAGTTQSVRLRALDPAKDKPISAEYSDAGADGWMFTTTDWKGFRLLELREPDVENCRLVGRFRMKSAEAAHAHPRLIARFPGDTAKDTIGKHNVDARGDTNWTTYEVTLDLKPGERPEVIEFGLHMEGKPASAGDKKPKNQVWIKDVELLQMPADPVAPPPADSA